MLAVPPEILPADVPEARTAAGLSLLGASAITRFGIVEGGMASARDPRYTMVPQKERIAGKTTD